VDAELAERITNGEITIKEAERELADRASKATYTEGQTE
jgi:hypothetical protein